MKFYIKNSPDIPARLNDYSMNFTMILVGKGREVQIFKLTNATKPAAHFRLQQTGDQIGYSCE